MADYKDITNWKDYNYLLDKLLDWEDRDFIVCLSMRVKCGDTYNNVYSYRTSTGNNSIGITDLDIKCFKKDGLFYSVFASKNGYAYEFPDEFYETISDKFDRHREYSPEYVLVLKKKRLKMKHLYRFNENTGNPMKDFFKDKIDWKSVELIKYIITKYEDRGIDNIYVNVAVKDIEMFIYDIKNDRYFTDWLEIEQNFKALCDDYESLGEEYYIEIYDKECTFNDKVQLMEDLKNDLSKWFEIKYYSNREETSGDVNVMYFAKKQ